MPNPLEALRNFLALYPPTKYFSYETRLRLVEMLKNSWGHLDGSDAEGMRAQKLDRMEELHWDSPLLRFAIERHGSAAMGSTRAEFQEWTVNVEEGTASCMRSGFRQLETMTKALKVAPVVEELVQLIEEGCEDQRLKWSADRLQVTVSVRKAIDIAEAQQDAVSEYKQTKQGRSRRLREALRAKLEETGWWSVSGHRPNTYEKLSS